MYASANQATKEMVYAQSLLLFLSYFVLANVGSKLKGLNLKLKQMFIKYYN